MPLTPLSPLEDNAGGSEGIKHCLEVSASSFYRRVYAKPRK